MNNITCISGCLLWQPLSFYLGDLTRCDIIEERRICIFVLFFGQKKTKKITTKHISAHQICYNLFDKWWAFLYN